MANFKIGEAVVYPSHGVGKISNIEKQVIAGTEVQLLVIELDQNKMSVKIPMQKAIKIGLRHLSSSKDMNYALEVLQGKAKVERGMWSKRAAEYESKINSGNVVLLAEVVRDLYKHTGEVERSYSERLIYESALNRFSAEYAIVYRVDIKHATEAVLDLVREREAA
jgi:CarD family transcriptional regulator